MINDSWELLTDKVNLGGEDWGFLFRRTRTFPGNVPELSDSPINIKPQVEYFVLRRVVQWNEKK